MKVSTAVLVAFFYASTSSALPIANGGVASVDKRQTSEIVIPITQGTALHPPDAILSGGNSPGIIKPDEVQAAPLADFPVPTTTSPPIIVPVASPAPEFGVPMNNMEPSKPGGIPPGARSPLAFKPGRKGTQGQQLKEEVFTDPTVQLSDEKKKFLEKVPDTIWDQITLQPPGTFERQLEELVFESKMPNMLVPLLATAP
ncbi:hypothetical protein TWF132_004472 [Orbilia oligospora]|nr:hypothetical protein TWF128_000744 [Orbilia oligospora]KAF3273951.1 hypothetical protein TWF132_004472 [Orbilia oligospora]